MSAAPLNFGYVADPTSGVFDNYTSKYFNHYLVESAKKKEGHNFRLLQHSNGIIVLCVDPSHALFDELRGRHPNGTDEKVTIQAVAFGTQRRQNQNQEGEKDLSAIQVKGKRKKNALGCQIDTCLCTVTLSTGTVYVMPACVNGFVLELNARLVEQPQLLVAAPLMEGFLAVINPSAKTTLTALKKIHTATSGETLLEEGE